MIQVFTAVKAALKSTEGVHHAGLFRNQFRLLEESKQTPFRCPATFIEFMNVTYLTNADKTQTGSGIVRIYLAEFDLRKKDEDFFAMRQNVHQKLQGLRSDDYFSSLNRIAENPDPDFAALTVWTMDYETEWADNSARISPTEKLVNDLKIIVPNRLY